MKTLRIEGTLTGSVVGAKTRRINGRSFVYLSRIHTVDLSADDIAKARAIMAEYDPSWFWHYIEGGIAGYDGMERRPEVHVRSI